MAFIILAYVVFPIIGMAAGGLLWAITREIRRRDGRRR